MCKCKFAGKVLRPRKSSRTFPNLTYLQGGEIIQSCFSVRTLCEVGRLLSAENSGIQGDLQKVNMALRSTWLSA